MHEFARICIDFPGFIRIRKDLIGSARILDLRRTCAGNNLEAFVRIWQDLEGFARICIDFQGFVMIRKDLIGFARICKDLYGFPRMCKDLRALRVGVLGFARIFND